MNIKLIVAFSKNYGIGNLNKIPWLLPQDLKRFKNITQEVYDETNQNVVIMGRKTWESLPNNYKPLPNRINIVISKTVKNGSYGETCIYDSLDDGIEEARKLTNIENIFIIGGERLYREAILREDCAEIFTTQINKIFECDRFFPTIPKNYRIDKVSKIYVENDLKFQYINYKKIPKNPEYQYLDLLNKVLKNGVKQNSRSGTTYSIFGERMIFDLSQGIPLLTTKKMAWKTCIKELLWFISGNTNNKVLQEKGVHIWDGNSTREFLDSRSLEHYEEGDLGPVYGFQWRHFGAKYINCNIDYEEQGVDQLQNCIDQIKNDPNSRRIVLSAWNPKDLDKMALPPCHLFCQFYTRDGYLDCQMYQRSADMFLGVPFNIFSYSVLLLMISHITGFKPGKFIHILGDTHIYEDHIPVCKIQLERTPKDFSYLEITRKVENIDDFKLEDFNLSGYDPYPILKAKMNI